ncbi:MAG: hypothetical protein C0405_12275 [Desulfovibrio sp.]|nr:hypothetical protein [Desulfovibrio sp.]
MPPPEILLAYDKLGPGQAQRILERFHKQSDHRMELEKIAVKTGARDSLLGIVSAFLLAALGIGCGTYVVLQGHSVEGTIIGGAAMVGLTTAFIHGTSQRRKERERKQKANP